MNEKKKILFGQRGNSRTATRGGGGERSEHEREEKREKKEKNVEAFL